MTRRLLALLAVTGAASFAGPAGAVEPICEWDAVRPYCTATISQYCTVSVGYCAPGAQCRVNVGYCAPDGECAVNVGYCDGTDLPVGV